jgi:hypothetical protein
VIRKINFNLLIFLLFLTACSSVPKNTKNSCAIFEERYLWYKHTKAVEKKWGVPVYIQLAFVKKESDFNWLAKPERIKLFKVIPYKRKSSSFGYSQAIKGTWGQYKRETGNKLATRARFKDSVDFIGWYVSKTHKILKIPRMMLIDNILLITKVGVIIKITLKIKRQSFTQSLRKTQHLITENN